jgi:hypothetical protein
MKQTQLLNFKLLSRVIATTVDTAERVSSSWLRSSEASKQGPQIETENEATRATFKAKKHANGWVGIPAFYLPTQTEQPPQVK